ncbi:non-ribosomal peptide synthetase [Thermothelomyces heterothallicus CBS 203.75]
MPAPTPMPFISGPAPEPGTPMAAKLTPPTGDLEAVIPLSKAQLVLWLDYLRRPMATHYLLTAKVDLGHHAVSLEDIVRAIHFLTPRHAMLRSTFHVEDSGAGADDFEKAYMAVHTAETAFPDIEMIDHSQTSGSNLTWRRGFDLSTQFPIRWVICTDTSPRGQGLPGPTCALYVVGHHIAVDGRAMNLLFKEVLVSLGLRDEEREQSGATTQNQLSLSFSYGDYIHQQNAYLRSPPGQAAREFWLSQVRHTTPFEWNMAAGTAAEVGGREIPNRTIDTWAFWSNEEIRKWSQPYKTSWFRIVASIVGLVTAGASMPTPHHDHALMVAFASRPPAFASCVSHMANTMPVRFPLSALLRDGGKATFADAVKAFGKNLSQAKRHEMYPFMTLMEGASKVMDDSLLRFKVALSFTPTPADGGYALYPVEGVWDLFFCFLGQDDGVSLGVIADPRVFDQKAVSRLKTMFVETAALSQTNPEFLLSSLSFLQNRDLGHIIAGPRIDDVDAISNCRVHQWIRARAAAQPDAVALFSAERQASMTYAEVVGKSAQIARLLVRSGTAPGDKVVLHIDRSFETVLWILGTLEAGACFVVIDKAWPARHKSAIWGVLNPKVIVTDTNEVPNPHGAVVINTLEHRDEIASMPKEPVGIQTANDSLASVIFTSGSTGQPKGVMIDQANISHYVSATRSVYKIGPFSRVLQFASFAFDASLLEWAVTLAYGGTLCFAENPQVLVGEYLSEVIRRNRVNFFHTTPSVLSTLKDAVEDDRDNYPSLRIVSVGGEASPAGLLNQWRRKFEVLHAYGPTETTYVLPQNSNPDGEEQSPTPGSSVIGTALPNMRIVICAPDSLEPLPAGKMGEMCIVGPQTARGYIRQEQLTRSKFHTLGVEGGRQLRLYRTGDRGFLSLENGVLSISGRMDTVREIKVRGYRVNLPEVERSVLEASDLISLASVQEVEGSLVALVVLSTTMAGCGGAARGVDTATWDKHEAELRAKLAANMPSYAVPSRFVVVDMLPLSPNGKIDHVQAGKLVQKLASGAGVEAAKPENTAAAAVLSRPETCPIPTAKDGEMAEQTVEISRANLSAQVSELWRQILRLSGPLGEDVSFFDAGGHSMLLERLHKAMTARFPKAGLRLLDLFSAATIRQQVDELLARLSVKRPLLEESAWSQQGLASSSVSTSPVRSNASCTSSPLTAPSSAAPSPAGNNLDGLFAITGLACRYPGANNLDQLWNLFMERRDAITTIEKPASRGLSCELTGDGTFVPRYGLIDSLDEVDGAKWSKTEEDVRVLDPQNLVFLDVASEALADAGISLARGSSTNNIGVFVGAVPNRRLPPKTGVCPNHTFEEHYRALLDPPVGTLAAYKLNLTGPSVTVNAACASSMTALHLALNSLAQGECSHALVGGVSIRYQGEGGYPAVPGRDFSPTGSCLPLDARADGGLPADGAAAILVRPLRDAISAGDSVYAVIEAHAIGSDGSVAKAGLGVPSAPGLARTVAAAVGRAPRVPAYIEMHASGTSWGDAIEVDALRIALGEKLKGAAGGEAAAGNRAPAPLMVGSSKGNCGNTEAASGLLSLMKAALSLRKGVVPPLRELKEANPKCGFDATMQPLREPLLLQPSDRVGVNSMGYGGSNAHFVLAAPELYGAVGKG